MARPATQVDTSDGICTIRDYDYSTDSNRIALATSAPASDGSCQSAGTTLTSGFDDADRITTTGYSYDQLGRTKTVPSSDTSGTLGSPGNVAISYHANDMVATLTQNGTDAGTSVTRTQDFVLDVAERVSLINTSTNETSTEVKFGGYPNRDSSAED